MRPKLVKGSCKDDPHYVVILDGHYEILDAYSKST